MQLREFVTPYRLSSYIRTDRQTGKDSAREGQTVRQKGRQEERTMQGDTEKMKREINRDRRMWRKRLWEMLRMHSRSRIHHQNGKHPIKASCCVFVVEVISVLGTPSNGAISNWDKSGGKRSVNCAWQQSTDNCMFYYQVWSELQGVSSSFMNQQQL